MIMVDSKEITQGNQVQEERFFEPLMDIFEENNVIHCKFDMPGVEKENVDIRFDKGTLTVVGKVTNYTEDNWDSVVREYRLGDYRRAVSFSDAVDPEKIEASLADGVLSVSIPRREELAKTIEITVS